MRQRLSILDGISVDSLRTRLVAMQQAYLDLTQGGKVQVASYAQGDGSKMVSYTQADVGKLTQAILAVQTQIDVLETGRSRGRRAPMTPVFR